MRILVTGAAGMVGRGFTALAGAHEVIAADLHPPFQTLDVATDDPDRVIGETRPQAVVHLASIVTPPPGMSRAAMRAVDVGGTERVIAACVRHGVRRLVVTSSGAAYGYHADNPVPLTEDAPLRGNPEFAYSDHKRQAEALLAQARARHPDLEQVVLRVGTVLAPGLRNQITALFLKPRLLAVSGSESPFVFIWLDDLARILLRAATDGPPGIYNVAGDGALGVTEIARLMGKSVLRLPAGLLRAALAMAKPLGLTRYGPEQVGFLQHRPVLDNAHLKRDFGYTPKTSLDAFTLWRDSL